MINRVYSNQPDAPAREPRVPVSRLALWARVIVLCGAFFLPTRVHAGDAALRDVIDREIRTAWSNKDLAAPERSSDAVFLRRIYLDLVGMIPTYEETTTFLGDADPQKREKLIERLLDNPRYARNQAQVWDVNLLGRNPQNVGHPNNRKRFRQWLTTQLENNEPYDRFVRKLLTAEEEGSQLFYVANRGSDDLATATMRRFLGVQLQCAKCHDHPFESWTQRDYYGMAGFFVRTYVAEGEEKDGLKEFFVAEKSTGDVSFTVLSQDAPPGAKGEPVKPKFLDGAELQEPEVPADFQEPKVAPQQAPPKPLFSRREKIVDWITARDNPYLAQAAVNRIWAQFMGRGFVHPVDDFNSANDPSQPQLLKTMESEFVARNFDMKWLVREIVSSRAYQASDVSSDTDTLPKFYQRARVRPLSAEELTASLQVAMGLGLEAALKSEPNGDMLKYLGEPADGEGVFQGSLSEHLYIHNGDLFRGLCRPRNGNLAESLLQSTASGEAKVERMFFSVLSREPTAEERARFVSYLSADGSDAKAAAQRMEEALWVLVASSEFRFNR